MNKKIERILSKSYFIGGSPCSGKSTISEYLANKCNLVYYKIDDYERKHIEKANSDKHPIMCKWLRMDWDERWMRPVELLVDEELEFCRERFEMILSELENFSEDEILIVEGAALLPELINKLELEKNRVIYMIPSKEFQVDNYAKRDFCKDVLAHCSKPEKAFENWMERDYRFGKKVKIQAEELGYKVIYVDGNKSEVENNKTISNHFGL